MSGASCQPGPSPTARALRLDGLRADGPDQLRALLAELPDPPWDVEVADSDPLAGALAAEGFEPYARVAVMARPIEGLPRPPYVSGVEVMPYRNDWAEEFSAVEAAAMEGLAAYREMGQPTGYEGAEGFDAFVAARGEGAAGQATDHRVPRHGDAFSLEPTDRRLRAAAARTWLDRGSHRRHRVSLGGKTGERFSEIAAEFVALKVECL